MQSLGLVVGFMLQLWAAAWFSNQTSTFQPKQAGHIWFMQTLCKSESSSLLWTPTALWDQAALTTSLMLSQQHRLIHMHQVVFVLFMVWLHHHEQQQLSPLSLMQSELKSCYYLDLSSFIFFVKHENSTKCANKSPEITRTGTECRVGCEHANSGSFFLFDTVHMKVSGWKHLSAFVCVGGVASPC